MKARWLSTFNLIGIALIALGIVGLCLGHKFVYDPGQMTDGREPWYYIGVGVLLIINGFVSLPEEDKDESPAPGKPEQTAANTGSKVDTRRTVAGVRSNLVSAANDRTDQAEP